MKVAVTFYAYLRELTGRKDKLELDMDDGATVAALLEELCADSKIKATLFDKKQQLKPEFTVLKNGREIKFLEGLDTVLISGDEISIFPLVAGGNQTV